MAPSAITETAEETFSSPTLGLKVPKNTEQRLLKAGIDPQNYPTRPAKPDYLDQVYAIRSEFRYCTIFIPLTPFSITSELTNSSEHVDPGTRADSEKKALLGAASKVIHLTRHIGTELHGIQLAQLTDQQKDELGLLIAERSVVFFRDQDITPQQQKDLGEWYGEIEVHPQVPQVPGAAGIEAMAYPKNGRADAEAAFNRRHRHVA